jgi:hypothetical protein
MVVNKERKRNGRDEAFEEKGSGGRLAALGEFFASRLKWGTQCRPPTSNELTVRITFPIMFADNS